MPNFEIGPAACLLLACVGYPLAAHAQSLPEAPKPVTGSVADRPTPDITFSNNWQSIGMSVNDSGSVSVAWFRNTADGRLIVCRHGGEMDEPPRCSPASYLP